MSKLEVLLFNLINFGLASPDTTKIEEIKNHPDLKTTIKVKGTIKKIIPLLGRKAYEISDQTGSVWVITEQKIPAVGEVVSIEGILKYQDILIDGENLKEFYLQQVENPQNNNSHQDSKLEEEQILDSTPEKEENKL